MHWGCKVDWMIFWPLCLFNVLNKMVKKKDVNIVNAIKSRVVGDKGSGRPGKKLGIQKSLKVLSNKIVNIYIKYNAKKWKETCFINFNKYVAHV